MPATAAELMVWLERRGSAAGRAAMARYNVPAERAFGIGVGALKKKAKEIGPDHALAQELWRTGWYEARMLAVFVDEPARVTAAQMERWRRDFDNWAICDTAAFALFDRTPHAWSKARAWAGRKEEFARRAGFALIWSLGVHDKQAPDAKFLACLPLLADGAEDERRWVQLGADMALRSLGKRNRRLNAAAIALARKLEKSESAAARGIGRRAVKELSGASVRRRLARAD